ncbi:MAG: serine protein kinase PrkA [Candidatus Yanofskybacteria bacterium]|nr:serine protein kinase PrkA [Candidatus Yanofskybacteria bacterium]
MTVDDNKSLLFHVKEVLQGRRKFETVSEAVLRMVLSEGVEKKVHAGKTIYDFMFFRKGSKHIVGWYDEINDFVHFLKDAVEGGPAKELAFVFVGEPGNGKTFFIDYLCGRYRQFLARPENRKYTFKFIGLDKVLGYDKKVAELPSLTFENPMILAMNLFENQDQTKEFLAQQGFRDTQIEAFYKNHRPLGASSEYLWYELFAHYDGDLVEMLKHIQVTPVPMRESLGITTGKYAAKDKITASAADLLGEESLQLMLLLPIGDPNRYDLQIGALARVGDGGIHFADEIFKNKTDFNHIYLQVVQNRTLELGAFKWWLDVLVLATSNSDEYQKLVSMKEESPLKSRCRICYVGHNTDYILQQELTKYSMGSQKKKTILGEDMHEDPNLNFAISVGVVFTRLPHSEKLTPIETLKLEAGETAGEKGIKTILEVKKTLNANPDVTKRWGQSGLGHRDEGKVIQILEAMPESNEGKCLFAKDVFEAFERIVLDYVEEAAKREKYFEDLKIARQLYREQVRTSIFNAYREDSQAVRKDVLAYVNMIIGMDQENLGPDKMWKYRDPQTGELKPLKIDTSFIDSVENRMGLSSDERKESHRNTVRKIYGQKVSTDPNYDFMDNQLLVKAVTDVRLESDVAGAGSLAGALANRTNEENLKIYDRTVRAMLKLGYCLTCAQKTIEYFITKEDES